ncbi:hypothetical protein LBMAG48_19510 [Phycisphaerae bacterium]|jgi:uncharacterized protein YxjI|nr:hypothetical protein LBMAG48_19510 [Phycisphaerae bacterium]
MAFTPIPGEQYTIRRQFFKLFGSAFHIYDHQPAVIGFCKQKSFKLKEDIRIFTDESMSTQLVQITARSIIDFGATYDVIDADGNTIASLRRKGLTSALFRDEWLIFDKAGSQIASLREQSAWLAIFRRTVELVSVIAPQRFDLLRSDGERIATLRQHFNPFVYRLGIAINDPATELATTRLCPKCKYDWKDQPRCSECGTPRSTAKLDHLTILAAATLVAIVEGRQN